MALLALAVILAGTFAAAAAFTKSEN